MAKIGRKLTNTKFMMGDAVPRELRKLVFTADELKSAVFDYCLRNGVRIPQSPIDELLVEDSDSGFLTMRFSSPDLGDPKLVPLGRDQVGAALIKYCSVNKIPMPRTAKKVLKVDDGEVAMMISLNWLSQKPSG